MIAKIRISAISYLNSKPFIYGIQQSRALKKYNYELETDTPSVCAEKLLKNEADIGLVPVVIIPDLKEAHIISDFCIGSCGPVKTVMLYSQVPLKSITHIYLDYQSRSSVVLAKILAKEYWDINPQWLPAVAGYEAIIKNTDAAVVIGDRAFKMNGNFKYEFDLAEEWQKLTNLPFVFACWVSNKKMPLNFITDFNQALEEGLRNIPEIVAYYNENGMNLMEYFTKNISYNFDIEKRAALQEFLNKAMRI